MNESLQLIIAVVTPFIVMAIGMAAIAVSYK